MAKIERYVAGGSQTPTGGGVRIPDMRGTGPGKNLASLGQAVGSVAQTIQETDDYFRRAKQASLMSGMKVGLARGLSDLEIEYGDRTDYENFSDVTEKLGKMRQEYMGKIGDDKELHDAFMPYFEMQTLNSETGVRKLARTKFVSSDRGAMDNELENIYEIAGRNVGNYDKVAGEMRGLGVAAITGRVAANVLSGEQGSAKLDEFEDKFWDNYSVARIRTDPIGLEEDLSDESKFPGMDRDKRLYWQGVASGEASKKRVSDEAYSLSDAYGSDYPAMYDDLNSAEGLSRQEKSKVYQIIETAESDYDAMVEKAEAENRELELDNVYSMMNERNVIGAIKAVQDSNHFTEEEKHNKIESLKNWQNQELWHTDPELEAWVIRGIDNGTLSDPSVIEFLRGMGLSNADTDKHKKRFAERGQNPVEKRITNEVLSYAKAQYTTVAPKGDTVEDTKAHFAYAQFLNQMRDELEVMEGEGLLTRDSAIKHIDDYFKLKGGIERWWLIPDKKGKADISGLIEGYTSEDVVPDNEIKNIKKYLKSKDMADSKENIQGFYEQNRENPAYLQIIGQTEQSEKE